MRTENTEMTVINFTTNSFFQDPYPTYKAMRELKGAHWLEHQDHTGSGGMWMFSRYADVIAILRNARDISLDTKRLIPEPEWTAFDYTLLHSDPPDHTRLRALISAPFSSKGVRKLEASISRTIDHLIDNMVLRGEVEFLQEFALPLPVMVICEMLGVPFEDADRLRNWTIDLLAGLDSALASDELHKKRSTALAEVSDYFTHLLNRRHQPAGSIIDQLASTPDTTTCSPQEALGQCLLLLVAGHETTVNLLCNGIFTLLSNPQELEKLRANPDLVGRATDEILRFEAPFQRTSFRVATRPLRIGAQDIQPGHCISAILSSANRDPAQFPEPDRFDISRKPNRHVSFGAGIHRCLGEKLARTEARIAFTRLLQRLPSIQLTSEKPRWQSRSLFRALESLPLRLV
jgi:cytochrome P450